MMLSALFPVDYSIFAARQPEMNNRQQYPARTTVEECGCQLMM